MTNLHNKSHSIYQEIKKINDKLERARQSKYATENVQQIVTPYKSGMYSGIKTSTDEELRKEPRPTSVSRHKQQFLPTGKSSEVNNSTSDYTFYQKSDAGTKPANKIDRD